MTSSAGPTRPNATRRVSRRTFLIGSTTAVAAGGAIATGIAIVSDAAKPAAPDADVRPICMAMHVHASASEGPGSMEAQLVQASRSGVDVLWWTEHDHRMSAHGAATLITFSGPSEPASDAAEWTWTPSSAGTPAHAEHVFCTRVERHELGARPSAVQLTVQARGTGEARHLLAGQCENLLNRTSLAGAVLSIEVFPTSISSAGFLAVDMVTSYRPSRAGVPAGEYVLSYRAGGSGPPGTAKVVNGTTALITMAAPVGRWTTLTMRPEADLARLWPGVDGQDAALVSLSVVAAADGPGRTASGLLTNLRFTRHAGGQLPLLTQRRIIQRYTTRFPTVRQIQALEVSLTTPHLGWYGPKVSLPDNTHRGPLPTLDPRVAIDAVRTIHDSGGLASYCHPFGTASRVLTAAEQERARAAKSAELIANRALGCDLVEVGYRLRGGCTLEDHESVWDNCSRNAIFLTGVGTSDDHKGRDWIGDQLNFVTWVWASDTYTESLLLAMRRGRAYFGDLARFRGRLDLYLDGRSAMGSISVSGRSHREVSLLASDLPPGSTVEVRRGVVDLAGPQNTRPDMSATVLGFEAAAGGLTRFSVDTRQSCFVRVVVKDRAGLPVAFSNPVWLLRAAPKTGVPTNRELT
jgi:hypothetical protein